MDDGARKWFLAGGCFLAFLAALVNAGFLIRLGTSVSHMTGDVSKVAVEALEGVRAMRESGVLLLAASAGFVTGAVVSGFWLHHPVLGVPRAYGWPVLGIAGLLAVSHGLLGNLPVAAVALAGAASGLQNALATHYRGMVLRTTHVTGLLTDFGTNLGMRLRGHTVAGWKLIVPLAVVGSFFAGALAGALLVHVMPRCFLLPPVALYLAAGLCLLAGKRAGFTAR